MKLPDWQLWLANPHAAWTQAEHEGLAPIIILVAAALVYWRAKNPLARAAVVTAAGGWFLYLGYEKIMPYFFK